MNTKVHKEQETEYDGSQPLKSIMQEMFVSNLLIGMNQRTAYQNAYKSSKTWKECVTDVKASELVRKPKVKARITYLRAGIEERAEKTVDEVIREFEKLAFSNMQDFVTTDEDGEFIFQNWDSLTRDQLAAVESVKVTITTTKGKKGDDNEYVTKNIQFKLANKQNALDSLAKRYKLFADNNINVNVVTIADIFARTGCKRLSGPIIDAPALPSGDLTGDMGDNAANSGDMKE